MNPPTTRYQQQPLLLEPLKAAQLDEVAKEIKRPKQELLREMVDDFLAMHGKGRSLSIEILRDALRRSDELVRKIEPLVARETLWKRKCYEARLAIKDALTEVGIESD
jgi:hypothetical protein